MVLFFNNKPGLIIVLSIGVVSKQMDEVHWCITNEQQYGEPYSKKIFSNSKFHLFSGNYNSVKLIKIMQHYTADIPHKLLSAAP